MTFLAGLITGAVVVLAGALCAACWAVNRLLRGSTTNITRLP